MANAKISALPAAAALTGAEVVPVLQGGANKRTTAAAIAAVGIVAKALVKFASDGTMTLVGATNIASVTRIGAGIFEATFTSAIPADCVCLMSGRFGDVASGAPTMVLAPDHSAGNGITTAAFRFTTYDGTTLVDPYAAVRSNSWVYFEIKNPAAF